MMQVYFVSADEDAERTAKVQKRISSALPNLIALPSIDAVERHGLRKGDDPICVLLLAPLEADAYLDRVIDQATKHRGRIFFVLISNEISASDYKRLVRSGSADWVDANGSAQEIADIIARQPQAMRTDGARAEGPVALVFLPSAGGVGNTTLGVEVAIQLKQGKDAKDRRVCLVDLDFQTSHVCDHLDIEPRLQIGEIASNPQRLDDQLFEIFISRHASGVHVFAAPRSKSEFSGIDIAALDALFGMIAARYDFIVIDAPLAWHPWTAHVIAAAHGVVVTGLNTIPGLRQIADTLAAVRSTPGAAGDVAVVLNRCERALLGGVARRGHVNQVLGNETVFFVTNDAVAAECINAGTAITLTAPSRKIVRDIAGITTFCTALKLPRRSA